MEHQLSLAEWCRQHIKNPLTVTGEGGMSISQKIAGIILLLIFGFFAYGSFSQFLVSSDKGEPNYAFLVFPVIVVAFLIFRFILIKKRTGQLIASLDGKGLATKNGKFLEWNNLKVLRYIKVYNRMQPSEGYKLQMIVFEFTEGKARIGFRMKGFDLVNMLADNMPVKREEKRPR